MEFSIVIPTCNRLGLLKQAIRSVREQTYPDYEMIVVDDGSTDGTLDYLKSLGSRVKALRQESRGPGAARNLGVRHALGDYIAFLDSDDVWFPWTLAVFHDVIQKHHLPSLVSAATLEFEGQMPDLEQANADSEAFLDYFETSIDPAYVGSGALVVKRAIFEQAGGFDETMSVGEDLDFFLRVGTCRDFVRVLSPVTLAYRRHPGNMSTAARPLYFGAVELLTRERNGRYPGGKSRQFERWKLLGRMVRPVAFSCLKSGLRDEAWRLFRQSLFMNVRLRRFRFIAGFALHGILATRLPST